MKVLNIVKKTAVVN